MKNIFKNSLFLLTSLFLAGQTAFADSNNEINNLLKERVDKKYNSAIVVAVIDKNGTQFYNAGTATKLDQNTLFPIASITKVFTTLLLAQGVENGTYKLNDPAQKYLPKLKLPKFNGKEITLEQLATHTSGLPTQLNSENDSDPYLNLTQQNFDDFLNSSHLETEPGKHYAYSNIGIGLLGDIISLHENTAYATLIKNQITKPLTMNATEIFSSPPQQIITGYDAADAPVTPYHFPILQAAGAMYSTAADLAKFVAANAGLTKTNLYPAMQLAHKPQHSENITVKNFDYPGVEQLDIGLGWNIDRHYHLVWKNGNMPGYSSFIGFDPKTQRGVVILANTGNVTYTDNLAIHILNSQIPLLPLYQETSINPDLLKQYAGIYLASDGSYYHFTAEGNHLKTQHFATAQGSPFFNIYPSSKNQFFGKVSDSVFTFKKQQQGLMGFTLVEGGKEIHALKTVPLLLPKENQRVINK